VLADRCSRKKLLALGLAINGLGFVLLGLAPTYPLAIAAVVLAGVGGSFFHPAATSLIAGLFPVNTGRALGLLGVGASAGFFAGPIYCGWRTHMLMPVLGSAAWRRPMLELGILAIAYAIIFAWLADDEKPESTVARSHGSKVPMFPTPALWGIFLVTCVIFSLRDFAGNGMGTLGSLFMQKVHGLDVEKTGMMLSFIFAGTWISNPLFGGLSDSGRNRWISVVLVLAALMMAAFPHVSRGWLLPLLVTYGFFFLASYPMVEAALMQSVPAAVRGRVFGLFITVGGLIGNLSHWALGELVRKLGSHATERGSYVPVFGAMGLAIIVSLAGLVGLHAVRRREDLAAGGAHAEIHEPANPTLAKS
ncbi:MAG TPA: MFS transporter, partial [Verrucomicrobiae bacterium]|nr:MFS transporter [Verrucomicrobiae bacterium]